MISCSVLSSTMYQHHILSLLSRHSSGVIFSDDNSRETAICVTGTRTKVIVASGYSFKVESFTPSSG